MILPRAPLAGNLAACFLFACAVVADAADVTYEQLNEAFGIPVWADENLWDDAADDAGSRLRLPLESKTTNSSSYRVYPNEQARVLETRPFSVALYGEDGVPSQISMMFANKGDISESPDGGVKRGALSYAGKIQADAQTIEAKLREVLGEPTKDRFGTGRRATEKVVRWDWNGHAILLAAPKGEYVAVRVIPASATAGGEVERVPDSDLKQRLAERVERRENGDVILRDIPMVDQGPKGYCVPATWERALRYVGIPADMYALAMAGSTDVGGGTSVSDMLAGVGDVVRRNGRRLDFGGGRVTARSVSRYIDKGLPIMWTMNVVPEFDPEITKRTKARGNVEDWTKYAEALKPFRRDARRLARSGFPHMCMIVGYNDETDEIAISDSWGPEFEERWITEEEANAISQGQFVTINW